NSDATAGNLVKASGGSVNNGNNENWDFGDDGFTIQGTLRDQASNALLLHKLMKLVRVDKNDSGMETLSAFTDASTGVFSFTTTVATDDRIVVFADGYSDLVGAAFSVIDDTGAGSAITTRSPPTNQV
ncbi:hypothetical protein ACFL59_11420, partial [Planctomycetota bacterium]